MPISARRKPPSGSRAWPWLTAVLFGHFLLMLALDRLTGRDAEQFDEPTPIRVRLVQLRPLSPPAPRPLPPAPLPLPVPPIATESPAVSDLGIQAPQGTASSDGAGAAAGPAPPLAAPPPRESLPAEGALSIQAFVGEYVLGEKPLGVGEIRLTFPSPDRYEIALTARATGWAAALMSGDVQFKSEGRLSAFGLTPERYSQVTPFRGPSESLFDPSRGAKLSPDAAWTYLPSGLQDRISVVFQLAFIAQTRPEQFGPGQRHVIAMATSREVKPLAFTVGDPEDLVLPGGVLVSALKVSSDPFEFRRQGRITLWLDPADRFYPVRIQYSEPGGRVLDFLAIRNPFAPAPSGAG